MIFPSPALASDGLGGDGRFSRDGDAVKGSGLFTWAMSFLFGLTSGLTFEI